MKTLAIVLAVIIVVLLGLILFWKPVQGPTIAGLDASSTDEGITSYDGTMFVTMPSSTDALVTSPLGIEGEALGDWFSEAVFPIKILDGNGAVLGSGQASAGGD